jgi:hypothetical protein
VTWEHVFGQAVVGPDDTAHHRPYHQPYHQPYHGLVDPTALLDDLDADQRLAVAA